MTLAVLFRQQFTLGVCLAIAAFSAGSNHAILTVVDVLSRWSRRRSRP